MKYFTIILLFVLCLFFLPAFLFAEDITDSYEYGYQCGITFTELVIPYIEFFGEPQYTDSYVGPDFLMHTVFAWYIESYPTVPYYFRIEIDFVWEIPEGTPPEQLFENVEPEFIEREVEEKTEL